MNLIMVNLLEDEYNLFLKIRERKNFEEKKGFMM